MIPALHRHSDILFRGKTTCELANSPIQIIYIDLTSLHYLQVLVLKLKQLKLSQQICSCNFDPYIRQFSTMVELFLAEYVKQLCFIGLASALYHNTFKHNTKFCSFRTGIFFISSISYDFGLVRTHFQCKALLQHTMVDRRHHSMCANKV